MRWVYPDQATQDAAHLGKKFEQGEGQKEPGRIVCQRGDEHATHDRKLEENDATKLDAGDIFNPRKGALPDANQIAREIKNLESDYGDDAGAEFVQVGERANDDDKNREKKNAMHENEQGPADEKLGQERIERFRFAIDGYAQLRAIVSAFVRQLLVDQNLRGD